MTTAEILRATDCLYQSAAFRDGYDRPEATNPHRFESVQWHDFRNGQSVRIYGWPQRRMVPTRSRR